MCRKGSETLRQAQGRQWGTLDCGRPTSSSMNLPDNYNLWCVRRQRPIRSGLEFRFLLPAT
jgi:hypothetical protein